MGFLRGVLWRVSFRLGHWILIRVSMLPAMDALRSTTAKQGNIFQEFKFVWDEICGVKVCLFSRHQKSDDIFVFFSKNSFQKRVSSFFGRDKKKVRPTFIIEQRPFGWEKGENWHHDTNEAFYAADTSKTSKQVQGLELQPRVKPCLSL